MAVKRSSIVKATAVAAVAATLVTFAIVADGFDVAQTPVNDSSIWALQAGDGNRYARINTELHELDTVKDAASPSSIVQTDSTALLFLENDGRIATVDPSRPADIADDAADLESTPAGTEDVVATGDFVAYRADNGRVFAARIDDGAAASPVAVDPYAADNAVEGAEQKVFSADTIAIGTDGILYAYSSNEQVVLRWNLTTGKSAGMDAVATGPDDDGSTITAVGSTWVLLSPDGETLWVSGQSDSSTDLAADAVLQQPSASGSAVFVASRSGLVAISLSNGDVEQELGGSTDDFGVPAAPLELDGVMYAAWLGENDAAGTMWSSRDGDSPLDYSGETLDVEPDPVLRSNGSRMILNEQQSGWVWTIPDGALVASSQDWGIASALKEESSDDIEQAQQVTERKPPVAVNDALGVRAGQLVVLPVLLNDHDPNEDVLTVALTSVQGLDPGFGVASVTNNAQDIAVQVAPTASGTATFTYQATDGSQNDGLNSEAATVTLTVFGPETNLPPVWCGVAECQREWPKLQVQPGASASIEVLRGWVDPEGDPIYVESATTLGEVGTVAATPDGTVVFQHPDAAGQSSGTVDVNVRVADIRGAFADKILTVEITPTPTLTVEPFAVTASAGELVTVDPAKFITGVNGAFHIESAKTEVEDGSAITVNNGARTFSFSAPELGNYLVKFTVRDNTSEVIATVRVSVISTDDLQLTTSPVTVFVRPKADATVDVFSAVSNPANKVLLLSEALPEPQNGSSLDVNVVDQRLLRVKGSTADGNPGVLGVVRYTVSDGTNNALATTHGEATVILLPTTKPQAPIAVADSITVRAGAQIDIPVLSNDLAPDGNSLVLNPDAVKYESELGLAFASGSVIRYLAPEISGDYELSYSVYTAGSPDVSASALVSITVLAEGENRAPEPRTLVGRVLAGATVTIPFDGYGIDPDGDDVRLDRILTQPESGSATISATGDAITYTSVTGFSGPVEFTYRVSDAFGESGEAAVRVGVLDAESDPSPITFSDYVEVQLGADNKITVQPAANDIDPANKTLEVIDVQPDAPVGSAEYDELDALIGDGFDDGIVTLNAGETLGTKTFFYTVRNSAGDQGIGLIVMKVVRESVPDHPKVTDTYLTLDDRANFGTGIDVVTGKVTWNSGSISDLTLSLWDKDSDFSVSGWKIKGDLPDETAVVPFKLSGTNVLGEKVSTFGFLRIPGKNDVILALRSGLPPQEVNEGESVSFDMKNLLSIPEGDTLVVDSASLKTAGQRPDASCAVTTGTKVTYTAGDGAPWVDFCTVPVKLSGQDDFTSLVVAITVVPEVALPILHPAALTLSPAAAPVVYKLSQMTTWAGKEDDGSLQYAVAYSGDQFVVDDSVPGQLTVNALDTANPGRENSIKVSLVSHPEVASTSLTLKVGPAPADLPKGGTTSLECKQSTTSNSCTIKVIGIPGEVNVYKTPLTLVSVGSTAVCNGVTMTVENATTIRATWTPDAPGGKCEATFVVKDAQGKLSPDDRLGTVLVDLKGFPKAPSSVVQSAWDNGTVKLSVNPGPASSAYPALESFLVYANGTQVSQCTPQGVCDEIHGLENGKHIDYEVKAKNETGESRTSVHTIAWAFAQPQVGSVSLAVKYSATNTTDTRGVVEVTIVGSDESVKSYVVTGVTNPVNRNGSGTTVVETVLDVGARNVTVSPRSTIDTPAGTGPPGVDDTQTVQVAGKPLVSSQGSVTTASASSIAVNGAAFSDNFSSIARTTRYIASTGSANCTVDADGHFVEPTGAGEMVATSSSPITGLTEWTTYNVVVCVWNGFGVVKTNAVQAVPYDASNVPTPAGYTYTVSDGAGNGQFVIQAPTSDTPLASPYHPVYVNYSSGGGASLSGQDPQIFVQACRTTFFGDVCGVQSQVLPADPARVFQQRGTATDPTCTIGQDLLPGVTGSPSSVVVNSYTWTDALSVEHTGATGPVDLLATEVSNISVTVTWAASGSSSYTWSYTVAGPIACTP